ncbi:MAG: M20/M25/M40 family metallo-hydrolase [bacterium]
MDSEVIQELLKLVRIRSVSGRENELADYISQQIPSDLNIIRKRNTIVAYRSLKNHIALVGHIDTVDNVNTKNGLIEGDRLYGLGASDMKAGIAIILQLIKEFYTKPVLWIFYDQEEKDYDLNGLQMVFEDYYDLVKEIDFAVILEPTSNNVELGCNGVINYGLWVRGKSGHSARFQSYLNPFYKTLPILNYFKNYKPKLYTRKVRLNAKSYILQYYSNAVITLCRGCNDYSGQENVRNVVPEYCFLNLNVRFTPNNELRQLDHKFRKIFERLGIDKVEIIDFAPAGKIIINKHLKRFMEWYISNGVDINILAKQGWTDVARFTSYSIPAINLGPGDPLQAHQQNESVSISKTLKLYSVLRQYLSGI